MVLQVKDADGQGEFWDGVDGTRWGTRGLRQRQLPPPPGPGSAQRLIRGGLEPGAACGAGRGAGPNRSSHLGLQDLGLRAGAQVRITLETRTIGPSKGKAGPEEASNPDLQWMGEHRPHHLIPSQGL